MYVKGHTWSHRSRTALCGAVSTSECTFSPHSHINGWNRVIQDIYIYIERECVCEREKDTHAHKRIDIYIYLFIFSYLSIYIHTYIPRVVGCADKSRYPSQPASHSALHVCPQTRDRRTTRWRMRRRWMTCCEGSEETRKGPGLIDRG